MKILFFIDSLRAGGKERRLTELLKGINSSTDIQFEVVVMSEEAHYEEIFQLRTKIHYLIRNTKKDVLAFHKFYKLCSRFKPDIVHCWDSMTAVYAIPACKLLGIKLVNGLIADAPVHKGFFNKQLMRAKATFPFSDIVLANSKAGLQAYNAPKNKSAVIYNGFNFTRINHIRDCDSVRQELKIDTKYVVGMVASLSVFKDYKTFFKAAQLVLEKKNDVTFLAIGSETDSASARSLFDQKYANRFKLLGKQTDVESLINAIDIGVLATFTEGISNSIMEYMALAKPVIATDGGGTSEILADKQTGLLVKASDAEELADKMQFLLNSPALSLQMGQKGRESIENSFSIEKMIKSYVNTYNSLKKNVSANWLPKNVLEIPAINNNNN